MLYFCNISWYKKYAIYYTIFLLLLAPFIWTIYTLSSDVLGIGGIYCVGVIPLPF